MLAQGCNNSDPGITGHLGRAFLYSGRAFGRLEVHALYVIYFSAHWDLGLLYALCVTLGSGTAAYTVCDVI